MDTITNDAATAKLTEYDFIVCIDASGSMSTEDCPGSRSRWAYMQESLMAFTRDVSKLDDDGIGLVVFGGSNITAQDNVTVDKVEAVFAERSPRGGTPLHSALERALALGSKSSKKLFVLVFTDGEPDDKKMVEDVIRRQANSQPKDESCTFLFVQIGRDADASKYLHHLDDEISGAKFDIVSAMTIEAAEKFATTTELVLYAIAN